MKMAGIHAAIVAGGQGTRASDLTGGRIPKALLPVAGVPIIIRQMSALQREGVSHVSVLAGHLGEQLQQVLLPEAEILGLSLRVIIEATPLGTAGCLSALNSTPDDWLIVYGDMLFDIALDPLFEFHRRRQAALTIVAHPNDHPRTSDLIVEENGAVIDLLPVGQMRQHDYRNLVPTGLYLASSSFFDRIIPGKTADMIRDVLPAMIASGGKLAVYNTPEYLRDVGTPARHALAERDLLSGRPEAMSARHSRPAIFFDCDGVLNDEPGTKGAVAERDIKLIPGAGRAVRRAREAGLLTVAITNRPQVAKGFVTFEGLSHILGRLEALLAEDGGGVLDRIYFCPHHPEAGFPGEVAALKIRCECRKPGSLLLRQAFADLPIEQGRSALIGDSLRDIGAARGAGIWAYGVRTGYGCRDQERYGETTILPTPDLMFDSVTEAVDFQVEYKSKVATIVPTIQGLVDTNVQPLLIALCGRSRSGKTSMAHALARVLTEQGLTCLQVGLDNWIVPAVDRRPELSAEARNRIELLPELIQQFRARKCAQAPGYNAASRGLGRPLAYDSAGQVVILLDGVFAGHASIRKMLDLVIFVTAPDDLIWKRFCSFYRWKGFSGDAIDALWRERTIDEWTAVDQQRDTADLIAGWGPRDS